MHTRSIVLAGLGSFVFAGCYASETHDAAASACETPRVAEQVGPAFEAELLRIASEYRGWTRVSDQANWSPSDCRPPAPSGVLKSESSEASTHGRKLYYLFAKDAVSYRRLDAFEALDEPGRAAFEKQLVGQALVKEAWQPVEVELASVPPLVPRDSYGRVMPNEYAIDGEHAYRTGEQAELFVMFKVDRSTSNTDAGWVYGTVSPDLKHVTSSGRVASCMRCHDEAGRDHLFGLPRWRKERLTEQQMELLRNEDQTVDH